MSDKGGERDEASNAKRYVLEEDHFSSEHLYIETSYHTACIKVSVEGN